MSKKAGWYPDPWPGHPGQPQLLRYWDGRQWTEHARSKEAAYAAAGPGTTAYAPPETAYGREAPPTTPDGQLLAGWWQRVGAYLIDSVIVGVIGGVLSSPWWGEVLDSFSELMEQAVRDAEAGVQTDTTGFEQQLMEPFLMIGLIFLALGFVYHVGFLMTAQATPGKLLLGLRVRLRERPGPLPLTAVLLRWASQFGYSILNFVPVLGALLPIYGLLDVLWPLWDGKKQALHDKVARTNVVRSR
jgi:uncharacterized RDD family membrane protein YckC